MVEDIMIDPLSNLASGFSILSLPAFVVFRCCGWSTASIWLGGLVNAAWQLGQRLGGLAHSYGSSDVNCHHCDVSKQRWDDISAWKNGEDAFHLCTRRDEGCLENTDEELLIKVPGSAYSGAINGVTRTDKHDESANA
ncbi:hypothetical protein CsSME_00053692 [Camellia sinensis var. sinensis]